MIIDVCVLKPSPTTGPPPLLRPVSHCYSRHYCQV